MDMDRSSLHRDRSDRDAGLSERVAQRAGEAGGIGSIAVQAECIGVQRDLTAPRNRSEAMQNETPRLRDGLVHSIEFRTGRAAWQKSAPSVLWYWLTVQKNLKTLMLKERRLR